MPLEEYRRKRDFAKTPEPSGEGPPLSTDDTAAHPSPGATPQPVLVAAPAGPNRFVVQRHRATRLHYDLRLEIDDVLVSWAVPKGPTLDPDQRRMAVHVEDHPVDYFDFEGLIPRGEYGAGDVIVWDWGHFMPEGTADPGAAVRAGELKFRLEGEKLRGRFTIVRTSGRGGDASHQAGSGEAWLLIHKRDEDAIAGWDAEHHPRSVKSGLTNDEVRAGGARSTDDPPRPEAVDAEAAGAPTPPEADLSAAIVAPMPAFIAPMGATLAARTFDSPDWLFEPKWDGYRVEALVRAGSVRLRTRNGNDAETYFGRLLDPPTWIAADEAIVDGEVVALDPDGRPDFGLLQEAISGLTGRSAPGAWGRGEGAGQHDRPAGAMPRPAPLLYVAFDLLYVDGRSLLRVPLEERKRALRSALREHPRVRFGAHVEAAGVAFFEAARERALEGVVAKRRGSLYEPGRRSDAWLKLKVRPEQEFAVVGYLPGEGSHAELGSILLSVHDGDGFVYAGRVGSGLDARLRAELKRALDAERLAQPPLTADPTARDPGLRAAIWSAPRLVARVRFAGWSREGLVRQPSFAGLDPGRNPAEVTREMPLERAPEATPEPRTVGSVDPTGPSAGSVRGASEAELEALATVRPSGGPWRIENREVKLTNLDKAIFPAAPDHPAGPRPAVTKRDLIRYYAEIGPVLLPHLAGRALNLQRFPDGAGGPGFWQKALRPTDPDWLHRWREPDPRGRDPNVHLVADSLAALAWLGNQAAIELHPWTARIEAPDRPTFALIDIDPGTSTIWEEVLVLARLYRTALGHLAVSGFPKVTGKRGIQVFVPVEPAYSFDETRGWVEALSRAVGAMVPELVSWEWSVAERGGRARLDYTQNTPIKTLVSVYSPRPAPGAPVSAPITWDELDDPVLRPDGWTITSVMERVRERGDLFAGAATLRQRLPKL